MSLEPILFQKTKVKEKLLPINVDIPTLTTKRQDTPRTHIEAWVALRLAEPDITNKEAAARLGLNRSTLQAYIHKAVEEGWLQFNDPIDRVRHEIIPKTVKNLIKFLDAEDKAVTIETAKGTVFKQFQDQQGISDAPTTILALRIETAPSNENIKIVTGHVVGKPKELKD